MKILTIFFFIAFNTSFGQTYKFDKLVKSEISTGYFPDREDTYLFNSKDYSYSMKIFSKNDSLISWIIDTKRNQLHYFNIDKKDSLKLNYLKTESFKPNHPNYDYTFTDIKIKRGNKKIVLTILDEEKRKIANYKLTIRETDENFFPFFQLTGAVEPFHLMNIEAPSNFIVLKSKGINISRNPLIYELKSTEDINVLIEIP